MIDKIKRYVKENATPLFKVESKVNLTAIFDSKGFWFNDGTIGNYTKVKSKPHLYVAFTLDDKGYYYIGKSFQSGGRWKRQHAYHLGTLAYSLLGTLRYDDQNHNHWIDSWFNIDTLRINNDINFISLKEQVYITFIPLEIYSNLIYNPILKSNKDSSTDLLHSKENIRKINTEIEYQLIKSYLDDGFILLNKQNV